MKLTALCPAKLNLSLAVGPKDERGYHPVRTVLQAVSLFDELELEFGAAGIEVVGAELPQQNSVTKALRLSREILSLPPVRIKLTKHIPIEAGLGGGSSDAAGLLRALASYKNLLGTDELLSVATAIGMDTPFFLTGGRAVGEHYGEVISALPDAPEQWYVIAKPAIGCSSAAMYALLDARPAAPTGLDRSEFHNDFEAVAPAECRELIDILRTAGAFGAALSGSGSAVFGAYECRLRAEKAQKAVRSKTAAASWVVRSVTREESLTLHP